MILPPADPHDRLKRLLTALNGWRLHPGTSGQTEWMHFIVFQEQFRLLINLSLLEKKGHSLVLATTEAGWVGGVERLSPEEIRIHPGELDAVFGRARLRWSAGYFYLQLNSQTDLGEKIEAELCFQPIVDPFFVANARIRSGVRFHWLAVSQLLCDGFLKIGQETRKFHQAAAYHDHNWGPFGLGDDLSWDWAVSAPREGWSMIFVRVLDRARRQCRAIGVLLWQEDRLLADFRGDEVIVETQSYWRKALTTVPRGLQGAPERASSLPQKLSIHARREQIQLQIKMEIISAVQVVTPAPNGYTLLAEAVIHVSIMGWIQNRQLSAEAEGILEVVDGAG